MRSLIDIGRSFAAHPLTRDHVLSAWSRFLTWQVKCRLGGDIEIPWIEDCRLVVRRGMTGATGNLYFGLHEFMSMGLALHFLRKGDLFVDAGANVGSYSVLASRVCGARSIAIEADADTGRDLQRNVEVNGLQELVRVHLVALGPSEGTVLFTIGRGAANMVVDAPGDDVRSVRQKTLDSLLGDEQPAMIKLDVEDYEEQVLSGARAMMTTPSLKVIALEGTTPGILKLFGDCGFERAYYDPFTRVLQRSPNELAFTNGKWTQSNEFFVRDWEFVANRVATARSVMVLGRSV